MKQTDDQGACVPIFQEVRSIFKLLFLIIFYACQTREQTPAPRASAPPVAVSILDTLKVYGHLDSLEKRFEDPEATLITGIANKKKFAIWAVVDSFARLYQQEADGGWVEKANADFSDRFVFSVSRDDVNGDEQADVSIHTMLGTAGNLLQTAFLFDTLSESFRYNPFFSGLTNCAYDKKGRFVRASWWGSVTNCHTKWKYRVAGDSLVLEQGVNYCPSGISTDGGAVVTFFEEKNGKMVDRSSRKGDDERMLRLFDQALWDSSEGY